VANLVEPPGIWFIVNISCMFLLCAVVAAGRLRARIGVMFVPHALRVKPVRSRRLHAPQRWWFAALAVRAAMFRTRCVAVAYSTVPHAKLICFRLRFRTNRPISVPELEAFVSTRAPDSTQVKTAATASRCVQFSHGTLSFAPFAHRDCITGH
jgi:hypothetical protein